MIDQNVEETRNVHPDCHGIGYGSRTTIPVNLPQNRSRTAIPVRRPPFQIPHDKILDMIELDGIQKGKRKTSKEWPSCAPKDGGILSQKEPPKHLTLLELSAPCDTLT
jgi:hypothetical protein